ncbi:Ras family protein [Dictyocaulus viviparus]|uniref:Ras family protein n=1 Tax=Dictyocaulus viviparus TaxID=29172 RepID=A0A0D8XYA8_DICVI|nr:Ras family protein [Dictyocaulus viviparus]
MIWDTAGQERFRSVTTAYYREADALLLVFDVSNRVSFENVRSWLTQVREYGKETVAVTLVGNKCDLGSARTVKSDEAKQLATSYNIPYIETSAKTGHNVNQAFTDVARRLIEISTGEKCAEVVDVATEDKTWNCCYGPHT